MLRLLALLMLPFAAACATVPEPPAFASDRISVEVRGQGPDVVLIPGLSSHPQVWESTIEAVPGYRYHLVHVAGFGGKAPGANAAGPVVEPVAAEIARYIGEQGLERPAVVGHSLGGFWAMMIAARHPDLASKVMVVDMMPFIGAMFGGPSATPDSVRPIAEQIRTAIAGSSGEAARAQVEQTIATMIRTESLRPSAVEHSLASDSRVSAQAMYELMTTDLRPELAAIRVPLTVLFVRGPGVPLSDEQMEAFYRDAYSPVAGARTVRVPEAYHFIMWDAPDAFRQALRTFLGE